MHTVVIAYVVVLILHHGKMAITPKVMLFVLIAKERISATMMIDESALDPQPSARATKKAGFDTRNLLSDTCISQRGGWTKTDCGGGGRNDGARAR